MGVKRWISWHGVPAARPPRSPGSDAISACIAGNLRRAGWSCKRRLGSSIHIDCRPVMCGRLRSRCPAAALLRSRYEGLRAKAGCSDAIIAICSVSPCALMKCVRWTHIASHGVVRRCRPSW